jgi:LAS superfamily LD-carboxypeptidase LdcB
VAALFLIFTGSKQVSNLTSSQKNDAGGFNKKQRSVNDPTSIWVVVNKGRILPGSYVPPDLTAPNVPLRLSSGSSEMQLRQEAAGALQQMFMAASQQNIHLMLASGYRSYDEQVGLYKGYVSTQGQQNADSSSARPGHSEHQLGLAADIEPSSRTCEVETCFADTQEGKWVAANAYKYGFIIRYPKDKDNLTGYEYEPWHVRYVGAALAMQIQQSGQTLEQFFGLSVYSDYNASSYQLKVGN